MWINQSKVGRNDFCPCGSQKKYKKCCLLVEDVNSTQLEKSEKRLGQRIQNLFGNNLTMLQGEQATVKISEIVLHLVEDFFEVAKTKTQHQFAISIVCTAWNLIVLFEPEQYEEKIEKFLIPIKDEGSYGANSCYT